MMVFLYMIITENQADININMNKISNTCLFDKVRIYKRDIKCIDVGKNKKYCNHYSLPNEFIVERGISLFSYNYNISPKAMYTSDRKKVADFYYSFICSFREDSPSLELNIVPTENFDLSVSDELIHLIITLLLLIIIAMIITCICPCLTEDNFLLGYIIGSSYNNNDRYYCE